MFQQVCLLEYNVNSLPFYLACCFHKILLPIDSVSTVNGTDLEVDLEQAVASVSGGDGGALRLDDSREFPPMTHTADSS